MSVIINNKVNIKGNIIDAAGAQTVSQKQILGDYVIQHDDLPLLIDRVGTGTQAHSFGKVTLSVTSGQYAIAQSKVTHPYFPGKSQTPEVTFENFTNQANTVKRIGYFSSSIVAPYTADFDGYYLEADGTTHNLVICNNGTKTTIAIADWDDPLDGTGPSGKTIDFTKFQVWKSNFLYLGGSSLSIWFNIEGNFVLAHKYNHANEKDGTIFQSPNQPIRYEIRSTTGTGSFDQICSTVASEGALTLVGNPKTSHIGSDKIDANSVSDTYLIKGIRLKSTNLHATVMSIAYSILTGNDTAVLKIIRNPSIAGTPVWAAKTNSFVDILDAEAGNPTPSIVTGGEELFSQYVNKESDVSADIHALTRLGYFIDGTQDEIVLAVQPITSNLDIRGSLNWLEV